ncbi:MAG: peroxiredoxin family protein [Deltaproteobacteria bacterium]
MQIKCKKISLKFSIIECLPSIFLIIFSFLFISHIEKYLETFLVITFIFGFIGSNYSGNFLLKYRDLLIILILGGFIVCYLESKNPNPHLIELILIHPIVYTFIYFLGYFLGKFFKLNKKIYENISLSFKILLVFIFLLIIIKEQYIAMSIWLIFIFNLSIILFKRDYDIYSLLLIFSPLFIIHLLLFLFSENMFYELGIFGVISMILLTKIAQVLEKKFSMSKVILSNVTISILIFFVFLFNLENNNYNKYLTFNTVKGESFYHPVIYNNDTITLNRFKGKVLVLDFWNINCGPCFKKFPEFEVLRRKFELNNDVMFFAVNTPFKGDNKLKIKNRIESLNYKFEKLYLTHDSTAKALGVKLYPGLIYINKDQTKVFSGPLEISPIIKKNSVKIIENLIINGDF